MTTKLEHSFAYRALHDGSTAIESGHMIKDLFHPDHEAWRRIETAVPAKVMELFPTLVWDDVEVRQRSLPFYPDVDFLIIKGPSWKPDNLYLYALRKGDTVCALNGTSPPIHAFNADGHLKLTRDAVLPYLQFFCFFVRGEEGPFYTLSGIDSDYLPHGMRDGSVEVDLANAVMRLAERFQSLREFGLSEDGKWRCSGTILYSNAIFLADFLVQQGGMVEMHNDRPVITGLPARISAPIIPEASGAENIH